MTPIPDDTIDRNRYILLYDDEPVMNAVIALRNAENGQDWWHLVLDLESGGYAVARFSDLAQHLVDAGKAGLEAPLADLVGQVLMPVQVVVDQTSGDLEAAREEAYDSVSQTIVVTSDDELRGVLPVGGTRGGLFDTGLVELAGQNATIPEAGVMSRRRKEKGGSSSAPPPSSQEGS